MDNIKNEVKKHRWEGYLDNLMKAGSLSRTGNDLFVLEEVQFCVKLAIQESEERNEKLTLALVEIADANKEKPYHSDLFLVDKMRERARKAIVEQYKSIAKRIKK